jgi:hypothetical protein
MTCPLPVGNSRLTSAVTIHNLGDGKMKSIGRLLLTVVLRDSVLFLRASAITLLPDKALDETFFAEHLIHDDSQMVQIVIIGTHEDHTVFA